MSTNKKTAKKILGKVFAPPIYVVFPFLVASAWTLWAIFSGPIKGCWVYLGYVLSFYTLIILVVWIVRTIPRIKKAYRESDTKLATLFRRYKEDPAFNGFLSLGVGSATSALFAGYNLVFSILYGSLWLITLTVYYSILAFLRGFLFVACLKSDQKSKRKDFAYRFVAWSLLVLDVALIGISVLVVKNGAGFSYSGYMIYVSAGYAFYAIVASIMNLFRFGRFGDPILTASKVLSCEAACVSLFALQTAMLEQFGGAQSDSFKLVINSTFGGLIALLTLLTSIWMIASSFKKGKSMSSNEG